MRHALLVSYFFPPRYSVGGKRFYRFARYLPEHGFRTTVITAAAPAWERLDPSVVVGDLPDCQVFDDYLSASQLAALPRRAYGSDGTIEAPTTPWRAAPKRTRWQRVRAELRVAPVVGPDARLIPAVAAKIARRALAARADVIYATGAPWETVVAAALGARRAALPFVVDFRDPWSFGPFEGANPMWVQRANRLCERWVVATAHTLTVTNETTRERYAALGGDKTPVACVRTGYDPEVRPEPRRATTTTLVHFGNCYAGRLLAPVLRAIARLRDDRRDEPPEIRVLNLGRIAEEDVRLATDLGLARALEYRTVIPYREGIDVLAGADLGIVLGAAGDLPWFLPGKLYDYVLAGVPILAATRSAEIARLLADARLGFCCDPSDVAGLARCIGEAVDARATGRTLLERDERAVAALSARATAGQLASVLADAVRAHGRATR